MFFSPPNTDYRVKLERQYKHWKIVRKNRSTFLFKKSILNALILDLCFFTYQLISFGIKLTLVFVAKLFLFSAVSLGVGFVMAFYNFKEREKAYQNYLKSITKI